MRYLINIIGPQAVGKTTILKELMSYLPHYYAVTIDDYRRNFSDGTPQGEMRAWIEMLKYTQGIQWLIIESSGTSNNTKDLVFALNAHVFNVHLTADISVRTQRKAERESEGYRNPPLYFEMAEGYFERQLTIDPDITINTENEQPYEIAARIIDLLPSEFI